MKHARLATALLVVILTCAAPQALAQVEPYVVEVAALDYAFGMPTEVPSGWTTFRMTNRGEEHHVMVLYRLPEGVTAEESREVAKAVADLRRSLHKGAIDAAQFDDMRHAILPDWWYRATVTGGPGLIAPGRTAQTTVHLEPGLYEVECGVKTPHGTLHSTEGMHGVVSVTEERSEANAPHADVRLTPRGRAFEQEGRVRPGMRTIEVHFEEQPQVKHDVHLARLEEGQTAGDVAEWMAGAQAPSPFEFLECVYEVGASRRTSSRIIATWMKPTTFSTRCSKSRHNRRHL
jgi:hypothetical protein